MLPASEATIPVAGDIQDVLLMAIADPSKEGNLIKRKPKIAAFMESRTCTAETVKEVAVFVEKEYDFKVAAMENIQEELAGLKKARVVEAAREKQDRIRKTLPESNPVPLKGCSSCKQPVKKQANCGACKAIIYCSTICQVHSQSAKFIRLEKGLAEA
jgi:hypothetical protein